MSVPTPVASGSSASSVSRRQPEPVPMSRMRIGRSRQPSRAAMSSAAPMSVSESGRGSSVAGDSANGRP